MTMFEKLGLVAISFAQAFKPLVLPVSLVVMSNLVIGLRNGVRRAYVLDDNFLQKVRSEGADNTIEKYLVTDPNVITDALLQTQSKANLKEMAVNYGIRVKSKDNMATIALNLAKFLCEGAEVEQEAFGYTKVKLTDAIDDLNTFDKTMLTKFIIAMVSKNSENLQSVLDIINSSSSETLKSIVESVENDDTPDLNAKMVMDYLEKKANEEIELLKQGIGKFSIDPIDLSDKGEKNTRNFQVRFDENVCFNVTIGQKATTQDLLDAIFKQTGIEPDEIVLRFGTHEGASVFRPYDTLFSYIVQDMVVKMDLKLKAGGKSAKKPNMMKKLKDKLDTKSQAVVASDASIKTLESSLVDVLGKFDTSDSTRFESEMQILIEKLDDTTLDAMVERLDSNNNTDIKVNALARLLFANQTREMATMVENYTKALQSADSAGVYIMCKTFLSDAGRFDFSKLRLNIQRVVDTRKIRTEVVAEMNQMTDL